MLAPFLDYIRTTDRKTVDERFFPPSGASVRLSCWSGAGNQGKGQEQDEDEEDDLDERPDALEPCECIIGHQEDDQADDEEDRY